MIDFGGIIYYLDLDELSKFTTINPNGEEYRVTTKTKTKHYNGGDVHYYDVIETKTPKVTEVDITKYEFIRMMIETLLDGIYEEEETDLGADRALSKKPLAYQLAFNTLYHYNILKEKEL